MKLREKLPDVQDCSESILEGLTNKSPRANPTLRFCFAEQTLKQVTVIYDWNDELENNEDDWELDESHWYNMTPSLVREAIIRSTAIGVRLAGTPKSSTFPPETMQFTDGGKYILTFARMYGTRDD